MPGWLQSLGTYLQNSWPRLAVAVTCLVLVVAHFAFPSISVDWPTVALIAIATFALMAPKSDVMLNFAMRVLPFIKKAKVAGVEVELSEEIGKLAVDVDKAKIELLKQLTVALPPDYKEFHSEVYRAILRDPRAALLLLVVKIDQQVMLRLEKHGLRQPGDRMTMGSAFRLGIERGLFPKETQTPFSEFLRIRNQIARGLPFDVDESLVLPLVLLGLDLLKLVSVEASYGADSPK